MQEIDLTLPLGSDQADNPAAGNARLINGYAEKMPPNSKSEWQIIARAGLTEFATLTGETDPIRAILPLTDAQALCVSGRVLYSVDTTGTATSVGGIPSDGMVTMARNRAASPQVAITCDGLSFVWQAGVLTQISDPDLPPAVSVAQIGGYFIWLLADGRHFASDVDDYAVNALSYATAEANPDGGVRNIVRGNDMVFFGTRSIEFWQVTGDDPYPLARTTWRDNIGCIAGDSVAQVDQAVCFVAHDRTVRMLDGYDAQIISNYAVARAIADLDDPSTIKATSWQSRQHTFYAISTDDWTWIYDITTQRWHEAQTYGSSRWMIDRCAMWGTKILCGGAATGKLYLMDHTAHDDAGQPIRLVVQAGPIASFPNRLLHGRLDLDVVAATAPAGETDAYVMIDWADDDAENFGTQMMHFLGNKGQAMTKVRQFRLGSAFTRTYRFTMSSAIKRCVLGAKLQIEKAGS